MTTPADHHGYGRGGFKQADHGAGERYPHRDSRCSGTTQAPAAASCSTRTVQPLPEFTTAQGVTFSSLALERLQADRNHRLKLQLHLHLCPDVQSFSASDSWGGYTGTKQPGITMRINPVGPQSRSLGHDHYVADVAGSPNKAVTWSATQERSPTGHTRCQAGMTTPCRPSRLRPCVFKQADHGAGERYPTGFSMFLEPTQAPAAASCSTRTYSHYRNLQRPRG